MTITRELLNQHVKDLVFLYRKSEIDIYGTRIKLCKSKNEKDIISNIVSPNINKKYSVKSLYKATEELIISIKEYVHNTEGQYINNLVNNDFSREKIKEAEKIESRLHRYYWDNVLMHQEKYFTVFG
jgi:hypothetical protein